MPPSRKRMRGGPEPNENRATMITSFESSKASSIKPSSSSRPRTPLRDVANKKTKELEQALSPGEGPSKRRKTNLTTKYPLADNAKRPEHMYTDMIKDIDKTFSALLKRQTWDATAHSGITADTFAHRMCTFSSSVETLSQISPKHAFLLMLYLADHTYGDIDCGLKSSGFGETEGPFKVMDRCLLRIINKRVESDPIVVNAQNDPGLEALEFRKEADEYMALVDKQLRNKRERLHLQQCRRRDMKIRNHRMKERREVAKNWVANALVDLVDTRDYISRWGIKHYFTESIRRLEDIKGLLVNKNI